jgi:hypothetical protein
VKDFFISYNKVDRAWAEWIAWHLEEAGYTTVIQAWDFGPGSNFVLEMQRATIDTDRVIAVLSPDYLKAAFTQPEWAAGFVSDPTGENGRLLPVRVRQCELKGLHSPIIYIDLLGQEELTAKEALLTGVKRGRAKPSIPPKYPKFPAVARGRSITKKPRFPVTHFFSDMAVQSWVGTIKNHNPILVPSSESSHFLLLSNMKVYYRTVQIEARIISGDMSYRGESSWREVDRLSRENS